MLAVSNMCSTIRWVVELSPVRAAPLWISEAVSAVAAGWPSPADDYLEGPIDLSERLMPRPAATFLVRASGWSMKGAGISDGDLLIVERGRTAVDGQIVIAVLPDFPDIPLLGREVVIWGVVCWVLHKTI